MMLVIYFFFFLVLFLSLSLSLSLRGMVGVMFLGVFRLSNLSLAMAFYHSERQLFGLGYHLPVIDRGSFSKCLTFRPCGWKEEVGDRLFRAHVHTHTVLYGCTKSEDIDLRNFYLLLDDRRYYLKRSTWMLISKRDRVG